MSPDISIRPAGPEAADIVAALHAASWRTTYRGILSDAYLDGAVEAERAAFWRARLAGAAAPMVLIAREGDRPLGFIAFEAEKDAEFGGLIDNFHVAAEAKGRGVGRALFDAVCGKSAAMSPGRGLYLWVIDANREARAVYARLGGREADSRTKSGGDGTPITVIRVVWPAPDVSA